MVTYLKLKAIPLRLRYCYIIYRRNQYVGGIMTAVVNGIQYIGGGTAPDEFIKNQAGTIDGTQTVENGVLAGPITIPGTITVTGTLVIV